MKRIEQKRIELRTANLYNYFCPNGKSAEFIKMVGDKKVFCPLFIGGNGTSKTATGANIVANICFATQQFTPVVCPTGQRFEVGNHNWREEYGDAPKTWFDHTLYNDFPYIKHIRIISDPETIKSKIVPELKKWFPKNGYKVLPEAEYITTKEGKPYESRFITKTGFTITLMTYEQDTAQFESVECGLIWFDEPPPKRIWSANVARTRMGGMMFVTLTPLLTSGWIKDEVMNKAPSETYDYVECSAWDNCVEKGVRGVVYEEDLTRMIKSYPEDEREMRVDGRFGHLRGLVFKNFNRKIHVIKPFPINYNDFVVYQALDTHPRTPDAVDWIAINDKNECFVIAEADISGTTKKLADTIKAIEEPTKNNNWRVDDRIIEPASDIVDQHAEYEHRSLHDRLEEDHNLFFEKGSKKRDLARRLITDALDYFFEGEEMTIRPTLYFFNTCKKTIYEMENYVWDEHGGKTQDSRDPKPKPKDKNDHHIENIGRILIQKFGFQPTEKKETKLQRDIRLAAEKFNALRGAEAGDSQEVEDPQSFI